MKVEATRGGGEAVPEGRDAYVSASDAVVGPRRANRARQDGVLRKDSPSRSMRQHSSRPETASPPPPPLRNPRPRFYSSMLHKNMNLLLYLFILIANELRVIAVISHCSSCSRTNTIRKEP